MLSRGRVSMALCAAILSAALASPAALGELPKGKIKGRVLGKLKKKPKKAPPPELKSAPLKKWQTFETWGWKAELPVGWKQVLKIKKDSRRLYDGKWGFHSPNKSFRLRVKVHASKGIPWKERIKRTYVKLHKHYREFALINSRDIKHAGRELFYLFGKVKLKRLKKVHDYVIFRMVKRFPKRKLRLTITFTAADDRLDQFLPVVTHFTDTFALVDSKSADQAIADLERAGFPR